MGMDSEIVCMDNLSDEELKLVNDELRDKWPLWWSNPEREKVASRISDVVYFNTGGQRYFSADYPKGHWPSIREAITLVLEALPGKDIRYGHDASDIEDHSAVTDELLAAMDSAWKEVQQ